MLPSELISSLCFRAMYELTLGKKKPLNNAEKSFKKYHINEIYFKTIFKF